MKRAAKERQIAEGKKAGRGKKKTFRPRGPKDSSDVIGETMGVSGRTWKRVEQVAKESPEELDDIREGMLVGLRDKLNPHFQFEIVEATLG